MQMKEDIQKQREDQTAYYKRPEVKAMQEAYQKAREKSYNQRSEVKAKKLSYSQRPDIMAREKLYRETPKQRAKRRSRERKYIKKRKEIDNQYLTLTRLRSLFRSALKHYSKTGKIQSSNKYGIDYYKIINHLKPFPKDLSNYEIHHIKPLHTFDLNDPEQIKLAFAPENHQWLTIEKHINIHRLKRRENKIESNKRTI